MILCSDLIAEEWTLGSFKVQFSLGVLFLEILCSPENWPQVHKLCGMVRTNYVACSYYVTVSMMLYLLICVLY